MTSLPPLLKANSLRDISKAGDQYAADLRRGIRNELSTTKGAEEFLAATYLTNSTRNFLRMSMDRIVHGKFSTSPSVYQLYSRYGGGKTHGLMVLAAAAIHPQLSYWRDQANVDAAAAKVIDFSGEDANPVTGMTLRGGHVAKSLAGYILYRLGGLAALEEFREGDDLLADPGADAFERLIGDEPIVIMIDELVQYLSKVRQRISSERSLSGEGVLTTLSALAKAVSNCPKALMVITVPEDAAVQLQQGNKRRESDAFQVDTIEIVQMLKRIESQLARTMYPMAPSDDADLPSILNARLFTFTEEKAKQDISRAYAETFSKNGRSSNQYSEKSFAKSYPFHPLLLHIITTILSANTNYQRVRGTLRLLSNALLDMERCNSQELLIHPFHLDPRSERIRDELVNKPRFESLDAAIEADITGSQGKASTVERLGDNLAGQVAITMLVASIAPDSVNGLYADEIADAILSPVQADYNLISQGVNGFLNSAIHVDGDTSTNQRRRFSRDPNILKEINDRRDALTRDTKKVEGLVRTALSSVYESKTSREENLLAVTIFPTRQSNVPDSSAQVCLGIVNPDFFNWSEAHNPANHMRNEDLLELYRHGDGANAAAFRKFPNNVIFLAANDGNLQALRDCLTTMEAADQLIKEKGKLLPEHQKETLERNRTDYEKAALDAIQRQWCHLFSPGNEPYSQWPQEGTHLEHRNLNLVGAPESGRGQRRIIAALKGKLLYGGEANLNPRTWENIPILKDNSEGITLDELRSHFATTPAEKMILNQDAWRRMVTEGINNGGLHIRTQDGEENPAGYDADWKVWAVSWAPTPILCKKCGKSLTKGQVCECAGLPPLKCKYCGRELVPGQTCDCKSKRFNEFTSDVTQGSAASAQVKRFMEDNGHKWDRLISCLVSATDLSFAGAVASAAQGLDKNVNISVSAQKGGDGVALIDKSPSDLKPYLSSVKRILNLASIESASVEVTLDSKAAPPVLDKLDSRTSARIKVIFR